MHYVIIDIETTGGSPKSSKITEIAMYKHDGKEIIDEFETLIDPEMPIPEFIVNLTGISDKMVENSPKFYEVAKKIVEFTEGCIFVAHNVNFDYGVIRHEFRKLGFDYRRQHLCTVIASRKIIPDLESYSLGKLTRNLGIELIGRHRAGGDAFATAKLFTILIEKDSEQLNKFIQEDLNPKILHPNLDLAELDDIPDKTGVYKFFNEFNQLIFIGKSKHIRRRIDQHLKNTKSTKGAQLIKEISRIEYEITGSEFISMLIESSLLKEHRPIFNPPAKRSRFSHGLFQYKDEKGYQRFFIGLTSKLTEAPLIGYISKKEAVTHLEKVISKFQLCQKLCDLNSSNSSCFQYSVNECNGACIQEESVEIYNQRAEEMMDELLMNNQNFYIVENGRQKGEKSIVLVENGLLVGYGYVPFHVQFSSVEKWKKHIEFILEDRDYTTLIGSFLKSNPLLNIIKF
jgi:DNA polymerase-3 subunit epsilon